MISDSFLATDISLNEILTLYCFSVNPKLSLNSVYCRDEGNTMAHQV